MDNNDPIQQSNLVTDDAVNAMNGAQAPAGQDTAEPQAPPSTPPDPVSETAPTPTPTTAAPDNDLDAIKKNALDELQPLLQHVEQSPEERYETVMMMIRTNDDANLISQAYEAAREITDERARANALLNIVSEIEYLKSKANN